MSLGCQKMIATKMTPSYNKNTLGNVPAWILNLVGMPVGSMYMVDLPTFGLNLW